MREQLKQLVDELLVESALVLAQEYLYTEFDWRIGVLNGRALYACRYYMVRNHWQIYNHSSSRNFSGGFDALSTFEVPRHVLQAALKSARLVMTSEPIHAVNVRSVLLADLDALVNLEHPSFISDKLSQRSFRRYIQSDHSDLFVAIEPNGALLGYGLVLKRKGIRLARLYSLAVAKIARGKGIANIFQLQKRILKKW